MAITVTAIQASADSQMSDADVTTNYGSDVDFDIGIDLTPGVEIFRAILRFSFSTIPVDHVIVSADLQLTCRVGASGAEPGEVRNIINVTVGEVTSTGIDWVESVVTWTIYDSLQGWGTLGGDTDSGTKVDFRLPTSTGPINLAVANLVRLQRSRGQSNFGIILKKTDEASISALASFHSSEASTESNRPVLTISHMPKGGFLLPFE